MKMRRRPSGPCARLLGCRRAAVPALSPETGGEETDDDYHTSWRGFCCDYDSECGFCPCAGPIRESHCGCGVSIVSLGSGCVTESTETKMWTATGYDAGLEFWTGCGFRYGSGSDHDYGFATAGSDGAWVRASQHPTQNGCDHVEIGAAWWYLGELRVSWTENGHLVGAARGSAT